MKPESKWRAIRTLLQFLYGRHHIAVVTDPRYLTITDRIFEWGLNS